MNLFVHRLFTVALFLFFLKVEFFLFAYEYGPRCKMSSAGMKYCDQIMIIWLSGNEVLDCYSVVETRIVCWDDDVVTFQCENN